MRIRATGWNRILGVMAFSLGGSALLATSSAHASGIMLPHLGGRDGAMSGSVVASPIDGPSILLFNPAGVADLHGTQAAFGFETGSMSGRYSDPASGFDAKTSEFPVAPTLWFGTDALGPWHVGVGVYGASGSAFDFAADPAKGMPSRLLGESAVLQLGLIAGREVAPGFRVGLQIAPSYGSLKGNTPSPLGNVAFDIDGFGIGGSVGLLYDVGSSTTIGLAYRAPGIVSMSGGGDVGGSAERVKIDLRLPQAVTLGLAQELGDRLLLTAQASWTRYSDFERGKYRFKNNPALDQAFIEDARNVVRWSAGFEYAVNDWARLRGGVSYEPWMIEASALRPTLYDTSDVMLMLGFGFTFDQWTIDAQTGFAHADDRVVTSQDQTSFPGRYHLDSGVEVGVTVSYAFAAQDPRPWQ